MIRKTSCGGGAEAITSANLRRSTFRVREMRSQSMAGFRISVAPFALPNLRNAHYALMWIWCWITRLPLSPHHGSEFGRCGQNPRYSR